MYQAKVSFLTTVWRSESCHQLPSPPRHLGARLVVTVALARSATLITQLSPPGSEAVISAVQMTCGWRRGCIKACGDWKAVSRFASEAKQLGGHSGRGSWQKPHKLKCSACKWVPQTFSRFYLFKSWLVQFAAYRITDLHTFGFEPALANQILLYPIFMYFFVKVSGMAVGVCLGSLSLPSLTNVLTNSSFYLT